MDEDKELDRSEVEAVARLVLDNPTAKLIDWNQEQLKGASVIRISGHSEQAEDLVLWSVILKRSVDGRISVADPYGGEREPGIYSTDYLRNLSCRLTAPMCYHITRRSDGPDWVWIEDIRESDTGDWSASRFGKAAFHLGQFNVSTMSNENQPRWPWVEGEKPIRHFVDSFVVDGEKLAESVNHWQSQLDLDRRQGERILRLHEEREKYLQALERMPPCICHGDADRRNLLFRRGEDGEEELVGIDWAFSGRSVLGDDSQNLVNGSVVWRQFDWTEIGSLDKAVFEGYIKGLRKAGWHGDESIVRFGHTCVSALKWGLVMGGTIMGKPWWRDQPSQLGGQPFDKHLSRVKGIISHTMSHAEEAEELAKELHLT